MFASGKARWLQRAMADHHKEMAIPDEIHRVCG